MQTWNTSDLARAFGVAHTTVQRYLDVLTETFMVRQLPRGTKTCPSVECGPPRCTCVTPGSCTRSWAWTHARRQGTPRARRRRLPEKSRPEVPLLSGGLFLGIELVDPGPRPRRETRKEGL